MLLANRAQQTNNGGFGLIINRDMPRKICLPRRSITNLMLIILSVDVPITLEQRALFLRATAISMSIELPRGASSKSQLIIMARITTPTGMRMRVSAIFPKSIAWRGAMVPHFSENTDVVCSVHIVELGTV